MKKEWFFESQRIFKAWKVENKKSSETIRQTITADRYEEKVFLTPEGGGMPEVWTLTAYRNTGAIYLLPETGAPIRTYLRQETY